MKHKFKITDATKEELIQYFFGVEGLGGGYRIGADKDRFLIWLERKRTQTLLDAGDSAAEASQKALHEYIDCVKKVNDAKDLDEKIKWIDKANAAYERYERFNKEYDRIQKKVDSIWEE